MAPVSIYPERKSGWSFDGSAGRHPLSGMLRLRPGRLRLNQGDVFSSETDLPENGECVFRHEGGVQLTLRTECCHNAFTVVPVLSNDGSAPVAVGDIEILNVQVSLKTGFSHAFINGKNMVENTGLAALGGEHLSNSVFGLTDADGTQAFAAGAIRPDDAWYDISVSADDGDSRSLKILCRLENTVLAPGCSRNLSPIRLYCGPSLSQLLERYAEDTVEQMVPRSHFKNPPSGWCSWYHYYGTDRAEDIRRNMQAIKASPLNGRLQVIQIDDGWNRPYDAPRNWGDWLPDGKYPEGMKALADEIHVGGFQAGLWLAPFSVDAGSRLYREHPGWLVKSTGTDGGLDPLAVPGGVFGLDLTHPEVQEFIRTTFRRVFNEWGFDYIKIDFLAHGALEGLRADQSKTGIEAFRIGMKLIREAAGPDKFILNCGSPIAASIGLCDGMRIGMDVGGRWFAPMNLKEWRYGNCCIKAAANSTLWRQWMHRVWWHNDPDCVILRNNMTPEEWTTFQANPMEDIPAKPEDFALSEEETLGWLRLIWLSGGMMIVSEDTTRLTEKHWEDLRQAWPLNAQPVRRMDQYDRPEVSILATVSGSLMVGLFNLSDQTADFSLAAEKLGLSNDWKFVERVSRESFSGEGETVCFPPVPPHAGRLWLLEDPSA